MVAVISEPKNNSGLFCVHRKDSGLSIFIGTYHECLYKAKTADLYEGVEGRHQVIRYETSTVAEKIIQQGEKQFIKVKLPPIGKIVPKSSTSEITPSSPLIISSNFNLSNNNHSIKGKVKQYLKLINKQL